MRHGQNELGLATGRKAYLFFGSDDTAEVAANIYSLIASCKLHGLDPERYLAEMIRTMPYWPCDRFLELAPAYWAQTRVRLDPLELEAELGFVTVPPMLAHPAEQVAAS
jgi:transposase